jgi:hypothetical protein
VFFNWKRRELGCFTDVSSPESFPRSVARLADLWLKLVWKDVPQICGHLGKTCRSRRSVSALQILETVRSAAQADPTQTRNICRAIFADAILIRIIQSVYPVLCDCVWTNCGSRLGVQKLALRSLNTFVCQTMSILHAGHNGRRVHTFSSVKSPIIIPSESSYACEARGPHPTCVGAFPDDYSWRYQK